MKIHLAMVLLLGACANDKDATEGDDTAVGSDDTGDTDDTDVACLTVVTGVYSAGPYDPPADDPDAPPPPLDGSTDVYYRDPIEVNFEGSGASAGMSLVDAGGAAVAFETEWATGNVQALLSTVLAADTTYTLAVDVCGVTTTSTFTTSSLGAPLVGSPADLVGRAFVWRLSDATITEPSALGFLASTYLNLPLLLAVTDASETAIDLLGGIAILEDDGSYVQSSAPTWDFPAGSFEEAPYFEAFADSIELNYLGTPIPIERFSLSGTFTADGTAIERGVGSGFGDTRYMAPLLNRPAEELGAVCEIAAAAGATCVPCIDGGPYCLYIVAEEITGVWEEGLAMTPIE